MGRQWSGGLHFGPAAWHPAPVITASPRPDENAEPPRPPSTADALADAIEQAGLRTAGPVSPSLAVQLRDMGATTSAPGRRIRAMVLNLLPTQPESTLPSALVRQAGEDVLAGLLAVRDAVSPRRVMAVVDRHDRRTLHALRAAAKSSGGVIGIIIHRMVNTYPQAHPTLLLRSLFGKKLPPEAPPTRANRIVVDPVIAWAIGSFAKTGVWPTHRPVQLFAAGEAPRLQMASIGQTVAEFLTHEKIEIAGRQIIRNGMLLGEEVDPARAKIDWATEMLAIREVPRPEPSSPCIACGWCVDHCPTALTPIYLYKESLLTPEQRTGEALEARHCIGCGLCSYVCPTRLPLAVHTVRLRTEISQIAVPEKARPGRLSEEAADE